MHAICKHACKHATTKCLPNLGQAKLDVKRLVHVEAFRNSEHIPTYVFSSALGFNVHFGKQAVFYLILNFVPPVLLLKDIEV